MWTDYLGWSVFGFGFAMEALADWQLTRHINNPDPNKGKFCRWGLWKYSRHPNYFFESLLWWGIWIVSCSIPKGFLTFFAPLTITLLVRYVSGVTLLEKKQSKHPEWPDYENTTNIFVPWFPKSDGYSKSD